MFNSGFVAGGADGTALGNGILAGNLYANFNNGTVVEFNLTTGVRTVLATGGSRGDFVAVDPDDGTLLLTQTELLTIWAKMGRHLRASGAAHCDLQPADAVKETTGPKPVCAGPESGSTEGKRRPPPEEAMPATPAGSVLRYLRRLTDDPANGGVSDADLLQRFVAHRDEAAFELLLWRHAAMVLGVCRGVLRDEHAAEDAFQATFLALARKAGAISRRDALGGWLHQVAYNTALKARARVGRTRARQEPGTEPDSLPAPVADADEWRELLPLLHEELNRLPAKYRTPLILCYLEGQTHADAARQIGWPKGTVSGRLARGRELLRKRLLRRGVVPAAMLGTALTATAVPPALFAATVRGGVAFASGAAAGFSPPVIRLAEGVLHAMYLSQVKTTVVSVVVGCAVLGSGLLGGWAVAQKSDAAAGAATAGAVRKGGAEAADVRKLRQGSIENLKRIALAVHEYHDLNNHFPHNLLGPDGKPLLSWRVVLLPRLGEEKLYKQFKLDEPWDSPDNLKLLGKMPAVFQIGVEGKDPTSTYYQGFADERGMFPPGGSVRIADVPDGLSNTLLVIEAGTPVPWTKPADLPYTSNKPLPKLGGPFPEVIHAAFADGAVHPLKRDFDEKQMRLAILRDDGEPQSGQNLWANTPPLKDRLKEEVRRALEEAAREAARAEADARKLEAMTQMAKQELLQARQRAEQMAQTAQVAQKQAAAQNAQLREENERLKAALRDVAAQLQKLAPARGEDRAPARDDVKRLAAELEKTRVEMSHLRAEVERLKKLLDK